MMHPAGYATPDSGGKLNHKLKRAQPEKCIRFAAKPSGETGTTREARYYGA